MAAVETPSQIKEASSPKSKKKEVLRKESTRSLIDGKRGSGSSATDVESIGPPGNSPKLQKKFIDNWRHACDKTKDRTKELLKKWRTLPEQSNEEELTPTAVEEQTGWSEHVWTTWVKRCPSGEDSTNMETSPPQLTPHQIEKLANFFTHLLDMDSDDVISLSDFETLFEKFRHFADWSTNSPEYHRLLEVQRGFIEYFLVPDSVKELRQTYAEMERTIRKEQMELDEWLRKWGDMLRETKNFLELPLWLQYFPQILFQVVNKSGSGNITVTELSTFYSSVVGLSEAEVNGCSKTIYNILTSLARKFHSVNLDSLDKSQLAYKDACFAEEIEKDISLFISNPANKRVLVFPPVSNYRRFIIHKLVEDSFSALKTFSIGEGEERRTVICFKKDYKEPALSHPESHVRETRTPAKRARTMPSIGIYRPPAARKLEGNASSISLPESKTSQCDVAVTKGRHKIDRPVVVASRGVNMPNAQTQLRPGEKKTRTRRPDIQVYVPRGQRIAEEHQRKLEAIALNRDCDGIELDLGRPFEESDGSDTEKQKFRRSETSINNTSNDVGKDLIINEQSADETTIIEVGSSLSSSSESICIVEHDEPSDSDLKVTTIDLVKQSNDELSDEEGVRLEDPVPEVSIENNCEENLAILQDEPCTEVSVTKSDLRPIMVAINDEVPPTLPTKCKEPEKTNEPKLNPDECDWESLFDDSGECLDPSLLGEITKSVEQVVIETPKTNYEDYKYRNLAEEFPHVVEIYNFPPEFKTHDLVMAFSDFKHTGFDIKWVDDTHALGIFSNAAVVSEVLCMKHAFVKTRCLSEGSQQSKNKARRCADGLSPFTTRPDTCAALARRLVTGALGVRLPTQRAEREAEKKLLSAAREKKRLAARQREQAWEGTLS